MVSSAMILSSSATMASLEAVLPSSSYCCRVTRLQKEEGGAAGDPVARQRCTCSLKSSGTCQGRCGVMISEAIEEMCPNRP